MFASFRLKYPLLLGALGIALFLSVGFQSAHAVSYGWCDYLLNNQLGTSNDLSVSLQVEGTTYTNPSVPVKVRNYPVTVTGTYTINEPLWSGTCAWNSSTGNGTTWTNNPYLRQRYSFYIMSSREHLYYNTYNRETRQECQISNHYSNPSVCTTTFTIHRPGTLDAFLNIISYSTNYYQTNTLKSFSFQQADLTPPTITSPLTLNGSSTGGTTSSLNVTLIAPSATDPSGIKSCEISNNGSTWTAITCGQSRTWNLGGDDSGPRTVFARVCDNANPSNCATTSASITYNDPDYADAYCLAPANGISLTSINRLPDGRFEIKFSISAAMARISRWKNSTYRVVANVDNDYNKYPWESSEENASRYATATPTFVGNEGTLIVSAPPTFVDFWDSQRDYNYDQMIRYLSIFPDAALYTTSNTYLCDGFVKGMKIPVSKEITVTGKDGTTYTILIEDNTSVETSFTATLQSPAGATLTLQGQSLTTGVPVSFTSVPPEALLNINVLGDSFTYNVVRPFYGERMGTSEQILTANPGVVRTNISTDITFSRRVYYNLDNRYYMSNDFTHYLFARSQIVEGEVVQTPIGEWTLLTAPNPDRNDPRVTYRITNVPREATTILLTRSPSSNYETMRTSNNNRYKTKYLLNQTSSTTSVTLPAPPDIEAPVVTDLTVTEERGGFVGTNTVTVSPIVSDDIGVTKCFAGRAADAVNTEVNCTGFTWDLLSPLGDTDGEGTIYFRAEDAASNPSAVFPKSLILDRSNPTFGEAAALTAMTWTRAPYSLNMTCADEGSGCADIWYSVAQSQPDNCGTPTTAVTGSVEITSPSQLCVRVRDVVGNEETYGPYTLFVDGEGPTLGNPTVRAGENTVAAQNNTYYLQSSDATISFGLADGELSGVDTDSCTMTIDDALVPDAVCTITEGTLTASLPEVLSDGTHTLVLGVTDTVGNPASMNLNIFIDSHNPTFTLGGGLSSIGVDVVEPGREMLVALPTSLDDSGAVDNPLHNSGIASVTVRVAVTTEGESLTLLPGQIDGYDEERMSLAGDLLTIRPQTDAAPAFPASVRFVGLPASNAGGTQLTYRVEINAFDQSGRGLEPQAGVSLFRDLLRFDTLSPTLDGITRLDVSSRLGTGTETDPYRVGASRELRARFLVTERTNNSNNLPSLPVTAASVETFDRSGNAVENGISFSSAPNCPAVDSQLGCSMVVQMSPIANFDGRAVFRVRDNAGNISEPLTFWVRQDSNRPTLLPEFTFRANVAENVHFKGNLYRFTAEGIDKNGADKELTAFVTYTNAANEQVTVESSMTETATNTYTFDAALGGIRQGQQNIAVYFEDNYGNRHQNGASTEEHTINYGVFHDSVAPEVTGFTYTWENNNVNLVFTGTSDLSYPLYMVVEGSTNGTDWTEYQTAIELTDGTGMSSVIENVPADTSVRVRFEDTVQDYIEPNVLGDSFTPNTFFIQRDMVLSVVEGTEQLRVGYVPETSLNLSRISGYDVTYTGPHGRTGSFTSPTSFVAAGDLMGTIDAPLMGTYTFTTTLRYNDGTENLVAVRTYEQNTDILDPRGTLTIAEVENEIRYDADTQTYYVRSNNPELTIGYTIAPQYENGGTRIYDDSLPLTLRVEGADVPANTSINPTTAPTGSVVVELLEDRLYTLQGVFTDGAGRSRSQNFRVIKDRAQPQTITRFVNVTSGASITLPSESPTDPAGTVITDETEVFLDVIILNEDEPVTITAGIDTTELTNPIAVPGLLAGQQGARYRLSTLTDNDLTTLFVRAVDRAGLPSESFAHIRRDSLAPVLTSGEVRFASSVSTDNPVPITAQFDDYTLVYYRLNQDGVIGEPLLFNGAIALPEGTITNLSITFEDAFGHQTVAYPITEPLYIDSVHPTATLRLLPDTQTNNTEVSLVGENIVDSSAFMDWEATIEGNIVGTGRIISEQYTGPTTMGTLTLLPNQSNTVTVILRDSLGNPSTPTEFTILHDDEAPDLTFTDEAVLADATLDWSYTVTDGLGSGISSVTAVIRNTSNGFTTSTNVTTNVNAGVYTTTWDPRAMTPGQSYVLAVTTRDSLENAQTYNSMSMTAATGSLDDHNPILDPISFPPEITGDRITVTVDNGSTIRYVATDMPRGDNLYLADVLANGENELATGDMPRQLTKFPVGYYEITITDNEGNTVNISDHLVEPYYLDAGADINGDGFGGGLSDHKLVMAAEAQGNIYSADAAVQARLASIKAIIETNIANQITIFMQR